MWGCYISGTLQGWAEEFIGWLWCNGRILTKCGPHTSSISVAALGFPCYRSSHPHPRKKSSIADMTSSSVWYCFPSKWGFSCQGTENSQMVPNQENMEGDQPVQSHGHAQQPLQPQTCVQEHCPSETGFPLSVFHAVHEMCLVLLFKALTYPYPVWFYLEGNNAVSIKKGWI